jgi:hypothetical protein
LKSVKDNLNLIKWFDFGWYIFSFTYFFVFSDYFKNIFGLYLSPYLFFLAIIAIGYGIIKVVFLRSGMVLKLTSMGKIRRWILGLAAIPLALLNLVIVIFPWNYRLAYFFMLLFFGFLNGLSLYKNESLAFFHWVDQKFGKTIRYIVLSK